MAYLLTPADIDCAVGEIEAFLQTRSMDSKTVSHIRLTAEEAMLRYRDRFGEVPFSVKTGSFMGKIFVSLSVTGDMYDPFSRSDEGDETDTLMRRAMENAGSLPTWKYARGTNTLSFTVQKKALPDWVSLIAAIVGAVVLYGITRLLPSEVGIFVHEQLFTPVLDKFMSFLGAVAGPMIFLSIVWGIYSIGDAAAFNVLGRRLGGRYIFYILFLTTLTALLTLPFFSLTQGEASAELDFSSLFSMLLEIVPDNLFTPFSRGNTLQILFVGICMGLAMIFISEKTQTVAVLAEQLTAIVQIIMNFVSRMVPFFIFTSVYNILASGELSELRVSYKLFFINLGGCLVIDLVYILIVCLRLRVRPSVFLRKAGPTALICLTTASSSAAFGTNIETCRTRFGVDDKLVNFGIPFGQVIYKPSVGLLFFSAAVCMAEYYGITISAGWLATAVFVSAILSLATPPIPGSAIASFSVLFAQLGIPTEAIAVVMALNIILDFLETPTDAFGGQCMLLLSANRFGMIDKETLRSPKT